MGGSVAGGVPLLASLARLGLLDGPDVAPALADGAGGLAGWLGWTDAIPLSAALQQPLAAVPHDAAAAARRRAAAEQDVAQVQAALQAAISDDGGPPAPARRLPGRRAPTAPSAQDAHDFTPHRERCQRLQQRMAADVAALRQRLRDAAAQGVPVLQRLAAVDAVLAQVLAPREQSLLALMPTLLQTHFDRLRRAAPAEPPSPGAPPPAWHDDFRRDQRHLLLAELDLRLLPVQGLLDALRAH